MDKLVILNSETYELKAALMALDACKFNSKVTFNLGRDIRILSEYVKELEDAKSKLRSQVEPDQGKEIEKTNPGYQTLINEVKAMMKRPAMIDKFLRVKMEDLDLEKNAVPVISSANLVDRFFLPEPSPTKPLWVGLKKHKVYDLVTKAFVRLNGGGVNNAAGNAESERPVEAAVRFQPGVWKKLVLNVAILRAANEALQQEKDALNLKYEASGKDLTPGMPNFSPFIDELKSVLDETVEIALHPITVEELELDKNPIPGSVFADLDYILVQEVPEEKVESKDANKK